MMKRKLLVSLLLVALLSAWTCFALAQTDPIICQMEVSPGSLSAPGPVNVTLSISNSGDTDMKDPVILYNPINQLVTDFGDNGAAILKAGETKTWTGSWDVNQRTLENGSLVFFVKYTLYKDNGSAYSQSQPIRGKIAYQEADAGIDVKRTISPGTAREGQTVTVKYDIINTGTVSLTNIVVQENSTINKNPQKIAELKAGETAQVKFPVTMGKKNLTSQAVISYQTAGSGTKGTVEVEASTVVYGEPAMDATLTSSAKGVAVNGKLTLTLELKNKGTVDYSDIRVTDPTLGEVFSNQALAKDGTLKLEKEITLPQTTEYQFTITAIDNTGTEVSLATESLTLTAVDPAQALHLVVEANPDRTEVYEQPGRVRFSVSVTNDSTVDAKDVDILHGATKVYTFASIPAGETRKLTRDAALSMAGKYQFTASTKDALDNVLNFTSNEMQIAFSVPTPAPATPTPVPDPTAEPVFVPQTMPPIRHQSIGTIPKVIQSILLPVLILSGLLLIGSGVLLVIATKRRAEQKKASEAAYDHLERSKRRDYVTPAEAEPPEEEDRKAKPSSDKGSDAKVQKKGGGSLDHDKTEVPLDDVELPHMKYIRDAYDRKGSLEVREKRRPASSLYDDEDLYGSQEVFAGREHEGVLYEESYDDAYGDAGEYGQEADSPEQDGYGETPQEEYGRGYAEEYDDSYQDEYGGYGSGDQDDQGRDEDYYGDDRLTDPYEREPGSVLDSDRDGPASGGEDAPPQRRTGRVNRESKGRELGY